MPNNIRLIIHKEKTNETDTIEGRLIGYVDDEELRAIANTENSAKKIFTAETMPYGEVFESFRVKQRVVVASSSAPSLNSRCVYISPPILYTSRWGNKGRLICKTSTITVEEVINDERK